MAMMSCLIETPGLMAGLASRLLPPKPAVGESQRAFWYHHFEYKKIDRDYKMLSFCSFVPFSLCLFLSTSTHAMWPLRAGEKHGN